jgi:hypothetical protein
MQAPSGADVGTEMNLDQAIAEFEKAFKVVEYGPSNAYFRYRDQIVTYEAFTSRGVKRLGEAVEGYATPAGAVSAWLKAVRAEAWNKIDPLDRPHLAWRTRPELNELEDKTWTVYSRFAIWEPAPVVAMHSLECFLKDGGMQQPEYKFLLRHLLDEVHELVGLYWKTAHHQSPDAQRIEAAARRLFAMRNPGADPEALIWVTQYPVIAAQPDDRKRVRSDVYGFPAFLQRADIVPAWMSCWNDAVTAVQVVEGSEQGTEPTKEKQR